VPERTFGPYRLIQQIAVGGMAEIYLAKAKGIGGFEKFLALKVIHPNFAEDEHFIRMLVDEAKIAVQLTHANIAQIFDLGRLSETYYIAMEFVDGSDLFRVLRRASELELEMPMELGAYVALEVTSALDYAHNKKDDYGAPLGIIHRDISPQNVLLSYAGEVKLVDFGIAKAAQRVQSTAAGVIKGKYYYMSPEQAWGDPVDHRTDVFSCGILLYEMLVGQMLYLEEDLTKLLDMVRKANIAPPSTLRRSIPPELDGIVMRALAARPEHRYASAHDFGASLERFLFSYAPDVSAARLAGFLDRVLGDERKQLAQASARRGTHEAISRADYEPDREHSVLFDAFGAGTSLRVAEEPAAARTPGVATPLGSLTDFPDAEEDGTLISGPPTFMPAVTPRPIDGEGPTEVVDLSGMPRAQPVLEPRHERSQGKQRAAPRQERRAPAPPPPRPSPAVPPRRPTAPPRGQVAPSAELRREPPATRSSASPRLALSAADPIRRLPEFKEIDGAATPSSRDDPTTSPRGEPVLARAGGASRPPPHPRSTSPSPVPTTPDPGASRLGPPTTPSLPSTPIAPIGTARQARVRSRAMLWIAFAAIAGATALVVWIVASQPPPSPARGPLKIVSVPPGASVRLDGRRIGATTPILVPQLDHETSHSVEVSLDGYRTKVETVQREEEIIVVLQPEVGTVEIRSEPPGAEVYLNGRPSGTTPITVRDVPHRNDVTLELRLRGYRAHREQLDWKGELAISRDITLRRAN
jgi:serine/threonine protein kinase